MRNRIAMATAALVGVQACGIAEEPSEADRDGAEDAAAASPTFVVALDRATTAESIIPQILEAGRPQLAAVCADYPDAPIRVFNLLDPGAYTDVPCPSVLYGGAAAGDAHGEFGFVSSEHYSGPSRCPTTRPW